jgi:hypothetical protein
VKRRGKEAIVWNEADLEMDELPLNAQSHVVWRLTKRRLPGEFTVCGICLPSTVIVLLDPYGVQFNTVPCDIPWLAGQGK